MGDRTVIHASHLACNNLKVGDDVHLVSQQMSSNINYTIGHGSQLEQTSFQTDERYDPTRSKPFTEHGQVILNERVQIRNSNIISNNFAAQSAAVIDGATLSAGNILLGESVKIIDSELGSLAAPYSSPEMLVVGSHSQLDLVKAPTLVVGSHSKMSRVHLNLGAIRPNAHESRLGISVGDRVQAVGDGTPLRVQLKGLQHTNFISAGLLAAASGALLSSNNIGTKSMSVVAGMASLSALFMTSFGPITNVFRKSIETADAAWNQFARGESMAVLELQSDSTFDLRGELCKKSQMVSFRGFKKFASTSELINSCAKASKKRIAQTHE